MKSFHSHSPRGKKKQKLSIAARVLKLHSSLLLKERVMRSNHLHTESFHAKGNMFQHSEFLYLFAKGHAYATRERRGKRKTPGPKHKL